MTFLFSYRRYHLPLRTAVRTVHGVLDEREGVLVRLEDEGGVAGYGEAAVLPWFGTETADEAASACAALGGRVTDVEMAALPARLGCLRFALQSAAERTGAPAAQKYLPVAALLPAGRAVLERITPLAVAGFRTFKWKVGVGDLEDEIALLDDVCAALPDGAKLRLDANGAWSRRQAERWLECCAERPVEFVEQPVAADARGAEDLLCGLADDYPTPLALDESLAGEGDVARWLGNGWAGVFVVKPSLLGDAVGVLERLTAAKAKVVFSSALETAVGARAALRLAFRWPGEKASTGTLPARALGFGVWPLFKDMRFDGPAGAPFLRAEDVENINVEAAWSELS
ncbi:MAG TPA: o-succinylbenzoate synthase [Opitutaceae bacterium]|jgi:O-succinylbenzoate synthase|nr:o-succinylbenzoate synthase [Opitutaceae bacterium]